MYEIIVIGNDLSSLMAAVRSSQMGKKTILLTDIDIPDYYAASGYTFDIDPFPWTGFEPKGILTNILSDLELPVDTIPLNPAFKLIFPEHRFDILGDTAAQISEIEREIGRNSINFRQFYKTVLKTDTLLSRLIRDNPRVRPATVKEFFTYLLRVPRMIWLRRQFSKHFTRIQASPFLKKAFSAELLFFSHLNPEGISPLSLAYALSLPFRNLNYPIGGKYRIIDSLKRKIESKGGIVKSCSTLQLKINEEVVVDISAGNGNSFTIKGRNVIVSTKWKGFLPFLLGDDRCSSIADKYTDIEATHYPFTLHIGIAEASIPENMSQYSAIVSEEILCDETDTFKENLLFLELSALGDKGRAPAHRRALSVTAFLKDSPVDLSNKELTEVSVRMMKSIEGLLPFLNESIDFIDIDRSIDISRKYQESINERYSLKQNPILGVSLLSNKTPLNNLSITGGLLLAGLGMEGEIISGLNALESFSGDVNNVQDQETGQINVPLAHKEELLHIE